MYTLISFANRRWCLTCWSLSSDALRICNFIGTVATLCAPSTRHPQRWRSESPLRSALGYRNASALRWAQRMERPDPRRSVRSGYLPQTASWMKPRFGGLRAPPMDQGNQQPRWEAIWGEATLSWHLDGNLLRTSTCENKHRDPAKNWINPVTSWCINPVTSWCITPTNIIVEICLST